MSARDSLDGQLEAVISCWAARAVEAFREPAQGRTTATPIPSSFIATELPDFRAILRAMDDCCREEARHSPSELERKVASRLSFALGEEVCRVEPSLEFASALHAGARGMVFDNAAFAAALASGGRSLWPGSLAGFAMQSESWLSALEHTDLSVVKFDVPSFEQSWPPRIPDGIAFEPAGIRYLEWIHEIDAEGWMHALDALPHPGCLALYVAFGAPLSSRRAYLDTLKHAPSVVNDVGQWSDSYVLPSLIGVALEGHYGQAGPFAQSSELGMPVAEALAQRADWPLSGLLTLEHALEPRRQRPSPLALSVASSLASALAAVPPALLATAIEQWCGALQASKRDVALATGALLEGSRERLGLLRAWSEVAALDRVAFEPHSNWLTGALRDALLTDREYLPRWTEHNASMSAFADALGQRVSDEWQWLWRSLASQRQRHRFWCGLEHRGLQGSAFLLSLGISASVALCDPVSSDAAPCWERVGDAAFQVFVIMNVHQQQEWSSLCSRHLGVLAFFPKPLDYGLIERTLSRFAQDPEILGTGLFLCAQNGLPDQELAQAIEHMSPDTAGLMRGAIAWIVEAETEGTQVSSEMRAWAADAALLLESHNAARQASLGANAPDS